MGLYLLRGAPLGSSLGLLQESGRLQRQGLEEGTFHVKGWTRQVLGSVGHADSVATTQLC